MTGAQTNQSAARIRDAQAGDKAAMDELVRGNLALVKFVVKRFQGSGRDFDDLYQMGCMGLVKAISRFDPSFGVRFSTYAVPVILGEIRRYLRDDAPIRVSRSIQDNARKIRAFCDQYEAQHQKTPTLTEMAQGAGLSREDVVLALDAAKPPRSLSEPIGEDGHLALEDTVGEDNMPDIDRRILLGQLLATLSVKEREILTRRYFDRQTQSQVALAFGMTQVQVSRLEGRLLKRLREIAV